MDEHSLETNHFKALGGGPCLRDSKVHALAKTKRGAGARSPPRSPSSAHACPAPWWKRLERCGSRTCHCHQEGGQLAWPIPFFIGSKGRHQDHHPASAQPKQSATVLSSRTPSASGNWWPRSKLSRHKRWSKPRDGQNLEQPGDHSGDGGDRLWITLYARQKHPGGYRGDIPRRARDNDGYLSWASSPGVYITYAQIFQSTWRFLRSITLAMATRFPADDGEGGAATAPGCGCSVHVVEPTSQRQAHGDEPQ